MAGRQDTGTRTFDQLMWRRAPDQLGFTNNEVRRLVRLLVLERGLVVLAGPAGSGKRTTLYSALRWTQTLRPADPGVTLVGEIRHHDVAQLALRAINAGQLVLATLDANDAPSAIGRLLEIGVDPVALGGSLRGVIAQRLLRRVCGVCGVDVPVGDLLAAQREILGSRKVESVRVARGCGDCDGQGYDGHMVVAEIAYIAPVVERAIARRAATAEIANLCRLSGMKTLWDAALDRVVAHHTTLEEVQETLGTTLLGLDPAGAHPPDTPATGSAPELRRVTDRSRITAIITEPSVPQESIRPLPRP